MSAFGGKAKLVGHLASAHLLEEYPRFLSTNPIPRKKGGQNSRKYLGKRLVKQLARKAAAARWKKGL